ncbi:branched-chain amino acid ABC transporter permease [Sporanaerobium hydrogeniformans]|uniref:Branched-chain amino acid ABC transporter permease n=1 Tax=Sporanaerobium hydrogeniformans TaxID=3072179 RepID=A0AC61DGP5_9FIRM|nr:branched-chain amino acid ABC transporter permease [Sporanaerobium hydrogeniformans]PHV71998.1 branched-chain amino acid ABC transporter permease [Sporanaerobium hydrogeniformans]
MNQFIEQIIYGIQLGSIYALIALGYTMVYGIVKLINFAHGDILMMGAYFGLLSVTLLDIPFGLAIVLSMAVCAVIGMLIDIIAYKPLRNAPRISALITAIGVSLFLENIYRVMFGAETRKMVIPTSLTQTIAIGNIKISYVTLLTVFLTIICMVALQLVVKKTKVGKAMRAVSEDQQAARLMGVNVNLTISMTFALGSALAALGGVLYSVTYYQVEPYMGMMPGLKAFVAAVLGGIGIIPGAMFGGYALGLIENLAKAYVSSSWSNAIAFGILILILLFKPAGLFGKNVREKV